MKNISLALNGLLLVAVAFLYYKTFSGEKSSKKTEAVTADSVASTPTTAAIELPLTIPSGKGLPFVFINTDTLFARYEYAAKAKASAQARVEGYQKNYQDKMEAFQQEYNEYVEKAGKGAYTKEQGLQIEAGLQKKRDDLLAMEQNQNKIMDDLDKGTADVQRRIYDFLTRFNKEHGYSCTLPYTALGSGALGINDSLDVTHAVIQGLNAEYTAAGKK